MKEVSDFWEARKAPTIFHIGDIEKAHFSEKVQSILEAISEGDCQQCLTRAKFNIFTEVINGNMTLLEATLLDSLVQDAASWAIHGWIEEFISAEGTPDGEPAEEQIRHYVEHLELFESLMAISFVDWSGHEDT